jgi:hypothetical protein
MSNRAGEDADGHPLVSKKELIDGSGQRCLGRAVRMLELLTLNQRVQGSSPCAPTNHCKGLAPPDRRIPTSGQLAFRQIGLFRSAKP